MPQMCIRDRESGLRITFDDAIRFRTEDLTLDSDPWGTALLRPDQVLMLSLIHI